MYTGRLEHRDDDKHKPGEPGQQPDGSYITPEGERLTTEEDKATYLRTAQDWIVTPLLKNTPGLAGVDSIGGSAKQFLVVPDVQKLASLEIGTASCRDRVGQYGLISVVADSLTKNY